MTFPRRSRLTDRRSRQRGVTLPELLVALFVFALISSVGVYALRLAVEGREQLTRIDANLRQWQLARITVRQDLMQIANRTARDEFGELQAGPVIGGLGFAGRAPVTGEAPLIGFVRAGWANYDTQNPRSTLQYVEYVLKDDDIVRRTRPYIDAARAQPVRDRMLFHDVSEVSLEFLLGETSRGLDWTENWPSGGTAAPQAVKLQFRSKAYGDIEQLFWIGDTSAAAAG